MTIEKYFGIDRDKVQQRHGLKTSRTISGDFIGITSAERQCRADFSLP